MPREIADRVQRLLDAGPDRVLLGITGCPGAGKSTLASWVVRHFTQAGVPTAWVPMDGFHLSDRELERLGRRDRKGALDTFDGYGYLALLRRIRAELDNPVHVPEFDRVIEQPIAGGLPVLPGTRLVVTEGNYLLDDTEPWCRVADELDEVWFCELDDDVRRARLVARHVRFGKSPTAAAAWVDEVDERNSVRVHGLRGKADVVWSMDGLALEAADTASGAEAAAGAPGLDDASRRG
ncbi:MAG: nucleoside/nucleotide kinase family protein [Nocardioidaceae bacterium]